MSSKSPVNPERAFGVSIGTVLLAIACYLLWRARFYNSGVFGTVGVLLIVLGVSKPSLLKWPSTIWWRFSRALGYVNARVLLTVMFVLVFVPIGVLCRVTTLDPLRRRRSQWSGWVPYPARYRNRAHYSRMY